jgi:hypothetical protein
VVNRAHRVHEEQLGRSGVPRRRSSANSEAVLRGRLSLSHKVADWTNSKAQYRRHLLAINFGFSFLAGQLVKGPKS